MKVVFVGPSLPDAKHLVSDEITIYPPAVQGDVLTAVQAGARVIGIVDGGFEYTAPVWHKEILYALSRPVRVFGAASMGALRAAECGVYGMVGVGRIYAEYAAGTTVDDADVALLHAPQELGYKALTVPLVNVRSTLDKLEARGELSAPVRLALESTAGKQFFKGRTWPTIVAHTDLPGIDRQELLQFLRKNEVDQKREDALALIEAVRAAEDAPEGDLSWQFNETFVRSA
ncbi:TfuA-like protein [Rhizobium cauense]|uniref:TfuA-like protein n=1 Tax=Rhizobium cauense TaxID=1166683 RepID=UPI001C6F06F7|nr:TfuA-like protein [Rhizobium cauense]